MAPAPRRRPRSRLSGSVAPAGQRATCGAPSGAPRVPTARRWPEAPLALIRTIWSAPDPVSVRLQLDEVAAKLERGFPVVATMLRDAREDLTAFTAFPYAHWHKVWSTNPLGRLNKEVKRRSDVIGIFPGEAAITRLAGAVLLEVHDEWAVAERPYLAEGSMALLDRASDDDQTQEVDGAKSLLAS